MPAGEESADPAGDEWDALAAANSVPDDEQLNHGRRITLDVALAHCEDRLGGAWVCQPSRWGAGPSGTLDGCAPVRVVWARFALLSAHRAIEVADMARAINLAFAADSAGRQAWEQTMREAFPPGE